MLEKTTNRELEKGYEERDFRLTLLGVAFEFDGIDPIRSSRNWCAGWDCRNDAFDRAGSVT